MVAELLTDPEPLTVEPEETVPPGDAPDGVVTVPDADGELTPPDADGELTLPVAGELTVLPDGELVLTPVPLVAPVVGAPDTVLPLLIEPEAPVPDVVGDADGAWLPETPAASIACWLHRSKSARVRVPAPTATAGKSTASAAVDAKILVIWVMSNLLEDASSPTCEPPRGEVFKFAASGEASTRVRFAVLLSGHIPARKEPP